MSGSGECVSLKNSDACTGMGDYYVSTNNNYGDLGDFDLWIRAQTNTVYFLSNASCNPATIQQNNDALRYQTGFFCTQEIQRSWEECGGLVSQASARRRRLIRRQAQSTPTAAPSMPFYLDNQPKMCQSLCMQAKNTLFATMFQNDSVCPFSAPQSAQEERVRILNGFDQVCVNLSDAPGCLNGTAFENNSCGFPSISDATAYCSANPQQPCCANVNATPTPSPTPGASESDNGGLAVGWRVLIALLAVLFIILVLIALLVWKRRRDRKKEQLAMAGTNNLSRNGSTVSDMTMEGRSNSGEMGMVGAAAVGGAAGAAAAGNKDSSPARASGSSNGSNGSITTLSVLESHAETPDAAAMRDGAQSAGHRSGLSSMLNPFIAALGLRRVSQRASTKTTKNSSTYGNLPGGGSQMTHSSSSFTAVTTTTTTTLAGAGAGRGPRPIPPNADVVEAIHVYLPTLNDELHLEIGDKILVLKRFDDGWASGSKLSTGEEGAFPIICTRPWSESGAPATAPQLESTASLSGPESGAAVLTPAGPAAAAATSPRSAPSGSPQHPTSISHGGPSTSPSGTG